MVFNLIDKKIRRAFSNAAVQYDVLSGLHKEIGRELVKKIEGRTQAHYILDIGMGTGWLTNRIKYHFPESVVVGMDFALGMIDVAKKNSEGTRLIAADALDLPFRNESFDVIVSNLVYQWVDDLPKGFEFCHQTLKKDGCLALTMFGFKTLEELFTSLEMSSEKESNEPRSFPRLPSHEDIKTALQNSGFKNIATDYEHIKVHFPDMMSLLNWIKGIGANALKRDFFIGKEQLQRAEAYYSKHFRDPLGVRATFEVIWVQAEK